MSPGSEVNRSRSLVISISRAYVLRARDGSVAPNFGKREYIFLETETSDGCAISDIVNVSGLNSSISDIGSSIGNPDLNESSFATESMPKAHGIESLKCFRAATYRQNLDRVSI